MTVNLLLLLLLGLWVPGLLWLMDGVEAWWIRRNGGD